MPDIVTSRTFADGEKNITAAKLNDIVGSSVIQPAFVSSKPATSTVAPTDNLLVLQAAGGTYAKAPFQTIIDSVNANLNTNAAIWSARLRSFNAIGNPTFEVDQRNVGNAVANVGPGVYTIDRWFKGGSGTYQVAMQQNSSGAGSVVPGTNYRISSKYFATTLTTAQPTLAAGDFLVVRQMPEGIQLRELINDVHSLQLLVNSSVAFSFSIAIRDPALAHSFVHLCTIPTASVWTMIQIPNIPVFPAAGNWSIFPGAQGYDISITLACGSTYIAPAADSWQNGNFLGAPGMGNFVASPVNSTFSIGFIQHEPGALCSTAMDLDFSRNLDSCLRYYQKTYDYDLAIGTANANADVAISQYSTTLAFGYNRFHKPMAKIPTVTIYNVTTGAANSVRQTAGVTDYAVSSVNNTGKAGFPSITFAATPAIVAGSSIRCHYTADTGW
jgi:hypothetical protein